MKPNWLSNFFKSNVMAAGRTAEELMASVASDRMQEADIMTLTDELKELTTKVIVARKYKAKEQKETAEEQVKVDNGITALNLLQEDLDKATNDGDIEEINEAMIALLDELEQANIDLAREQQEDIDAEEDLTFWEGKQKELADYLKKTKSSSEKLKKELERQEAKTERAKDRAEFGDSGRSASTTAANAMERKLQKLKDEEAIATDMSALTTDKSVTKTNSRVAAAMARAKGEVDTSSMTASERLAEMKKKMGK